MTGGVKIRGIMNAPLSLGIWVLGSQDSEASECRCQDLGHQDLRMSQPRVWSLRNWGLRTWRHEDLLVPRNQGHHQLGSRDLGVLLTWVLWVLGDLKGGVLST